MGVLIVSGVLIFISLYPNAPDGNNLMDTVNSSIGNNTTSNDNRKMVPLTGPPPETMIVEI